MKLERNMGEIWKYCSKGKGTSSPYAMRNSNLVELKTYVKNPSDMPFWERPWLGITKLRHVETTNGWCDFMLSWIPLLTWQVDQNTRNVPHSDEGVPNVRHKCLGSLSAERGGLHECKTPSRIEGESNFRAGPFGTYYAKALMFWFEHYKFVIGLPNETWKFQVQEALDWMGSYPTCIVSPDKS